MSTFVKTKFNFETFAIYQEGLEFLKVIYIITKKFPKEELFGVTSQLRRAAVSIILNIAEGSSRTRKDFAHFLSLSKGSCFECVAILEICKSQEYITDIEYNELYEKLNKLSRMISKFQATLRTANNE